MKCIRILHLLGDSFQEVLCLLIQSDQMCPEQTDGEQVIVADKMMLRFL